PTRFATNTSAIPPEAIRCSTRYGPTGRWATAPPRHEGETRRRSQLRRKAPPSSMGGGSAVSFRGQPQRSRCYHRPQPLMATTAVATTSRRVKDELLGRVIAGRYRLEARLGEGGMGVVYRARHVLIERVVALKLIRPDLRGETHLRAWMVREARAANRVDHAHIVDIHDVGETEENELYLVMEYLVGDSLSSQIAKGPMPLPRTVDILEQMCAALSRAHDLGVVHRDLKSDNVMLTMRGGRKDFVKILDFGLAHLARDPRLAPKGAVFGTPEYMAPEQARGED